MKGDLALGFDRAIPAVPPAAACECHGVAAVAVIQVKVGRATTKPATVCEATAARIHAAFPATDLIETEVAGA